MENYHLEKSVWSDCDFSQMGWHDANIWSVLADTEAYEFMLDLDYIFKWIPPVDGEARFRFWVSPVTMVFENAHSVSIDIKSELGAIEVAELHRENPVPSTNGKFIQHTYRFECRQGEISLMATGYKMYVRQYPLQLKKQILGLKARNGVNFDRVLKNP